MSEVGLLTIALAITAANPPPPNCADRQTIKAAQLNEFQTMMMAVSLRCVRVGDDMRRDFDAMLARHQVDFSEAGRQVKRFFGACAKRGGSYDRYSVAVANKYGGGSTPLRTCKLLQKVMSEVTRTSDEGTVVTLVAEAMIPRSVLETFVCPSANSKVQD